VWKVDRLQQRWLRDSAFSGGVEGVWYGCRQVHHPLRRLEATFGGLQPGKQGRDRSLDIQLGGRDVAEMQVTLS
jgi:hypothetical protein